LKSDDSERNWRFSLRNTRGFRVRNFALRAEKKHSAISCKSEYNPGCGEVEINVSTAAMQTQTVLPALALSEVTAQTRATPPPGFHDPQYFTRKQIDVFETAD
jgi:hypothetical protein